MTRSTIPLTRPKPVEEWPAPPLGGACGQAPDWLFHTVARTVGAVAAHVCLTHCPVLAQCRRYARQYTWLHVVVAGEHWILWCGEPTPAKSRPTSIGCAICAGRPWGSRPDA